MAGVEKAWEEILAPDEGDDGDHDGGNDAGEDDDHISGGGDDDNHIVGGDSEQTRNRLKTNWSVFP